MLDPVFFLFMALAIFSYGVQGSLQTYFTRKYDAFVMGLYRNVSLIVTMSPILFFATREQIAQIAHHIPLALLASSTGAAGLLLAQSSSRYLPIGTSTAIRQIVQVCIALAIGTIFLREWLTVAQLLLLTGIVFSGVALTLLRSEQPHLDPALAFRGITLTALSGIVVAITFYYLGLLSRATHPLVAGYFWELGVGLFVALYLVLLTSFKRYSGTINIPIRDAAKIVGIALLTIPATVSYAFALTYGPYALATGLLTATTLVATLMGWLIYREHLTRSQVVIIIIAVGLMFLLKVLS